MFTQFASGTFSVEVGGNFHCGLDHTSPKNFGWSVRIEWDDSALDENGFLLDNQSFKYIFVENVIKNYFAGLHFTTDSYELLVLKAAKHFKAISMIAKNVTASIEVPGLATVSNTQP